MPVMIGTIVISFLAGLLLRERRAATALAAVLGLLSVIALVWAVADGKGNDPWWIIPIAVAGAALAIAGAIAGHQLRARRTSAPRS